MKTTLLSLGIALSGVLAAPAHAQVYACTPVANCSIDGKPCTSWIEHADTRHMPLSPLAGDSYMRVRLCTAGDALCSSSNPVQAVSVFAYSNNALVYSKVLSSLNAGDPRDTNTVTLPPLNSLRVRCNNPGAQNHCKVVWQHCRKQPPIAGG